MSADTHAPPRRPIRRRGFLLAAALWIAPSAGFLVAGDAVTAPGTVRKAEAREWREDLRFMASEMKRRHRNLFHTVSRERFELSVRRLDERIPSLARHQIIVEMARIAASVGDGHTNIAPTRDPKIGFRAYPIQLYLFAEGLSVRAASREHADIVGLRVLRVGKASADEAYRAVRELVGRDNEMGARYFAPHLLVMPEILHGLGLVDDMEDAPFTLEGQDGPRTVRLAPAGPAELMSPDTDASWAAKPGFVDARDGAPRPAPLWLRAPQDKYWFECLPEEKAVYVQYNQVGNKEGETIEAFAERLLAFVDAHAVERLVLDLRLNRGGNGELNRPILLSLIRARTLDRPGRLFVLIGRGTWSAAQSLVNELERYTEATFVGEPTGGKVNSYGDSVKITLPHSGITVRVSSLWWQGDERDKRPWIAPQVAADLTSADYRANVDPALEAALRYGPEEPLAAGLREAVEAGDFALAQRRYAAWRADPVHKYADDAEARVNSLGYTLLSEKRLDAAIDVFRLNAEAFPESANAHDSLGEAYAARGDREAAIRSYEQALRLEPASSSAADALRRLRGAPSR
jgi:tetratricopeptide (TPR) repeat protein